MRDVTLLWALRSPCNLGCTYCYFGTIEDHKITPPSSAGTLSHLSRSDLPLAYIAAFAATLHRSAVRRVFIAGGEPLIWVPSLDVAQMIKAAGAEVVLCTNGIPLNRPEVTRRIIDIGVDAVSISLDSPDPAENDRYRPARNSRHGHADVIAGARALLAARAGRTRPRVGIYSVITRRTIAALPAMAELAAALGADYFVPQPVSLPPDHPLYHELALRPSHASQVAAALNQVYAAALPVSLPDPSYAASFTATVQDGSPGLVAGCFGGHTLFFIEPDGSVWDCPSSLKIAATPATRQRSIRGADARHLFGSDRPACPADCALFSGDCVNMWPLMDFDTFVPPEEPPR
jgi:MoaA/NifB/PqqE/SkfB family radical SAM enzyme